ncbi:tripartite tricarboxylate transporter permease [Candidatus Woesearchaeota archaeon]|nr:tripartite tricarboxylate transporter permease [Candidatus Woesearchaeota archaeon]
MMLEILAAVAIGIVLGIFTGLIPGVHVNLVAAVMLTISPFLLQHFSPLSLAAAIIAMSITHVFLDFVPSIFLGAPSDATALAVLPGHRLLLQGRGYEAVFLSAVGGFFGVAAIVGLLPLIILAVKQIFAFVSPHIGLILLGIVLYNIVREKGFANRFWSFAVIALAGMLGVLTLSIPNLEQPLLPLLAGLFGISTLMAGTMRHAAVPIQLLEIKAMNKAAVAKSVAAGSFAGGLMGIFPALGPAQASMLARDLIGKAGNRTYLVTLGAVSTSSMLFGLVTLFTINKARNGSIAMMAELVAVGKTEFIFLIAAAVAASGAALILTIAIGKFFAMNIHRISYEYISCAIIFLIAAMTFYFSQLTGLIILVTGTAIGLLAITKNVARHNLMSCLMMPVIFYYL